MRRRSMISLTLSAGAFAISPRARGDSPRNSGFYAFEIDETQGRAGGAGPRYDPDGKPIYFVGPPVLTGSDLMAARVVWNTLSRGPAIEITLSPRGSRALQAYSAGHAGERLAFVLDGDVLCTPLIVAPIKGQTLELVLGSADQTTCERVARRMQEILGTKVS